MSRKRSLRIIIIILLGISLFACGGEGAEPETVDEPVEEEPFVPYVVPEFRTVEFNGTVAERLDEVHIDSSHMEDGYIAVSAVSDMRLKFRVVHDEEKYNYDLPKDGTVTFYPLQLGDGEYIFYVYKNIVDTKYSELYKERHDVVLKDSFDPYLRPNQIVNYQQDSACADKARELASQASTPIEVVAKIYEYIIGNVVYDYEKAETVPKSYLPVPDETLQTGKGICFDYAALAASMLRSVGIPAKLITGKVSPKELSHAWNMFYTEETGWVTAEFKVNSREWTRIDMTFSANGVNEEYIGNGENYTDLYQY
ncbi:MAG: transglutaminase domain-containing protein [Erysipelotrichaceae bacterium]|nr:transglutaminase domain-containing protein [Erysipelotrichaceae bacterium]